jgi:hypothetical protein
VEHRLGRHWQGERGTLLERAHRLNISKVDRQSDITDEQYQTELDIRTYDIGLKRTESDIL